MPEGHTIHRLAADHRAHFHGDIVRLSSPQGRFAAGATLLDGHRLTTTDAHGKHLFLGFSGLPDPHATAAHPHDADQRWIHVHLGLYGTFRLGAGRPGQVVGTVRLRMTGPRSWAELRGPTTCEVLDGVGKTAVHARLGPDPLRADADPDVAWHVMRRSTRPVAALLMEQRVIAGVGNIYRAEVLFRHGVDPLLPGKALPRPLWHTLWNDLVELMTHGVHTGRIDTVRPAHTPEAMGRPPRQDDHGGEVYVYRRTDQPCLLCGTPVRTGELAARTLFWCPRCQPPHTTRPTR